jgi:hypothetical protein
MLSSNEEDIGLFFKSKWKKKRKEKKSFFKSCGKDCSNVAMKRVVAKRI